MGRLPHFKVVEGEEPKKPLPKPPPVFITKVLGEEVFHAKMNFSEAEKAGILEGKGFALTEDGEEKVIYAGKGQATCPCCGRHRRQFEKTGRFGCVDCYVTFADVLPDLLQRIHRGPRHLGKIPAGARTLEQLLERFDASQRMLSVAVEAERFEEAALIRDSIRGLDEEIQAFQPPASREEPINPVRREMLFPEPSDPKAHGTS